MRICKNIFLMLMSSMLVQRSAYATSQKFHSTYFQPNFSPLFPDLILPDLVVFDLDMCMWQPEMYTLYEIPTEKSEKTLSPLLPGNGDSKGVIGVRSGDEIIRLFPAALKILQDFYFDKYPGMKIAVASSADTPLAVKIGRSAMNYLEVVPGVSMRSVFAKGWPRSEGNNVGDLFEGNMQIGRTSPLSEDKSRSHFPIIREKTGIAYNRMLFFDDCLWSDHCATVSRNCAGVVSKRTPSGLQTTDWVAGLKAFHQQRIKEGNSSSPNEL